MSAKRRWPIGLAMLLGTGIGLVSTGELRAGEKEDYQAAFSKALAFCEKEDFPAAIEQYERALELAPRVFGPDDENTALVLNNLGILYDDTGQSAKAEPLLLRSLKIREAKLGPEHLAVADSLNNLAILYNNRGQHEKAEPLYQRCLKIRESKLGSDHLDVAASLRNLAILYFDTGEYAKAEPFYQRCFKIREAKLGPDHPDVAASLLELAILHRNMGQYAQAEPLFQRSLRIREEKLGPKHLDVAAGLNSWALNCQCRGEYAQAEPLFQRSLQIFESTLGPDHRDVAATVTNLARLYQSMGDYAKAEPLYQRGLKIREAVFGRDHLEVATSINSLASLYDEMGQFAKAEPLYQRGLKIREARLGPDHIDVAASLNNLAVLYYGMGQFAQAEPLYQRSLKIREAKLGLDHPYVAGSLSNLAAMYKDLGQYAQAEPLYLRSLKIRETKLGLDHPDVAASLSNLAELYDQMGQFGRAESLNQRSLKIRESKLGPDHPEVAITLNNLAVMYKDMGRYAEAEPLYRRNLKIKETKLGPDHPDLAMAHNNLAWVLQLLGRVNDAASECDRARRIVRRHVAEVLPVLSEREQLTFLERRDETYFHCALSFGRSHRDNAELAQQSAGWLINGKGVVQESLAQRALLARDSADPAVAETIHKLSARRTELARLSLAMPKPGQEAEHRDKLSELSSQVQELARQVNLAAGRPAQENPWVEPAAVRAALAADAALVDIIRFRPYIVESKWNELHWRPARYVAWVVPAAGKGNVEIIDLGPADEIDRAVEAARQAIEQSASKIKKSDEEERAEQVALVALTKLAALVLEPLKPQLTGVKQLILSPDSNLWLVPWAALPVDEGKYAIEQWQIRYVTSGRDLVVEQTGGRGSQRASTRPRVFADPDYDLDGKQTLAATRAVLRGKEAQLALRSATGRSESGAPKVNRLPATAVEARLITPALQNYAHAEPTIYSQQYALEGVLKLIASPRVLVLSTHGYYLSDQEIAVDDKAGAASELLGDARHGATLAIDGKPLENPLLRCGLLLAGCNQPPTVDVDDGVVTGMEIIGCDLRGTELVVLSACQTGLGQVRNGEGVAGLRQAFQLAGAKAVVSTLWRIPDEETATLMTYFFRNLAAGKTKAEALSGAQLTLIKTRRHDTNAAHPLYWAAFTLTGN